MLQYKTLIEVILSRQWSHLSFDQLLQVQSGIHFLYQQFNFHTDGFKLSYTGGTRN